MDEETDDLSNFCTDLVSLRRWEPAVRALLVDRPAGAWTPVGDLGEGLDDHAESLLVAWLDSPSGEPGYSVIVFHDPVLKWSMTANYNSARLLQAKATSPSTIAA